MISSSLPYSHNTGAFIQLPDAVWRERGGGETAMGAVGVAEQKHWLADRPDHRNDILYLILQAVTLGRVRLAPAPVRDGVNREPLPQKWV